VHCYAQGSTKGREATHVQTKTLLIIAAASAAFAMPGSTPGRVNDAEDTAAAEWEELARDPAIPARSGAEPRAAKAVEEGEKIPSAEATDQVLEPEMGAAAAGGASGAATDAGSRADAQEDVGRALADEGQAAASGVGGDGAPRQASGAGLMLPSTGQKPVSELATQPLSQQPYTTRGTASQSAMPAAEAPSSSFFTLHVPSSKPILLEAVVVPSKPATARDSSERQVQKAVPEINAAHGVQALALLAFFLLLTTDRRKS
jgi:hypothetical protein